MTRNKTIYDERQFAGHLGIDDKSVPIKFKAHMTHAGEARLTLDQIPLSDDSVFILHAWHGRAAYFRLSAKSDDGVTLQTERLYFNSIGPHSSAARGSYYVFDANPVEATFICPLPTACDRPILTLWLRGFRCFPQVTARSELGRLTAAGDVQNKDAEKLSGHVSIHAAEVPADIRKWRQDAEHMLNHVRRVMSFAEGTNLGDPVMQFTCGKSMELNVQSRSLQYQSARPTIHTLDRQSIFDAAVRSFSNPPHPAQNLWMALEWFAMAASYKEAQLVNAMTALENLVSSNTRDVANLLRAGQLKRLSAALKPAIADFASKEKAADPNLDLATELADKLPELRRRTLKRKLAVLVTRWSVPLTGIDPGAIDAAFSARNDIIHEGRYYVDGQSQPDLALHIGVVRELFTRMVFCAIGFEGRYLSQLGGYQDATFPPPKS